MQITLRQAAEYLHIDESTIRRWIKDRGFPVHRVNERLHANAIEVWEWAMEHGVSVSRKLLDEARRSPDEVAPLSDLLRFGGIRHDVSGDDKSAVLAAIVAALPLPPEVNREFLLTVLDAREAMGSTGIGDGIAIPHVRNPILLHVTQPFVTLALLRQPVPFDAVDGKPVHAIFMVVSPSVPAHLRILAQLGFVLRDAGLRELLRTRASSDRILGRIVDLQPQSTGSFPIPSRGAE
ncbi:MAG TPA: PTS sugar transporter subunit IIA [Gemmatimonadales bacterium]|nr:PTS sugar transporter subunit IIA [Gemmatimonadales bacterium]